MYRGGRWWGGGGGSSPSSHLDFAHGGDEVDSSNCPAPADTITSGADPAADRNKESVAGFDLAKLWDYQFKIPQSKRDEAIRTSKTLPSRQGWH